MNPRTAVVAVGVVALLVGGLAGYLYGTSSKQELTTTEVRTVSAASPPYDEIANAFALHMLLLSERNASAIVSQYEDNANVTWFGKKNSVGGLAGEYDGSRTILLLMNGSFIGAPGASFTMGNVTTSTALRSNESAVVNSTFTFFGQAPNYGGDINGTVSARDLLSYSPSAGSWLISQESWDFLNFNARGPVVVT